MDRVLDLYVKSADYDFKKDLDNQQIIMQIQNWYSDKHDNLQGKIVHYAVLL